MDRYDRRESRPSQKIFVSNLNTDTTESDLRKNFETYGTIVDVCVKSKDSGIVFAFIEFDSTESATKAVEGMNGSEALGREIKVEFAKGNRDRNDRGDRGGFRGDRGGRDFDRGRRDFGDRPKGCFNCQEEGHFARDCPKPRQPREFNRDRDDRGSYRNSGRDHRNDRDRRDRDRRRRSDSDSKSRSRSRSNDRRRKDRRRRSSSSSSRS